LKIISKGFRRFFAIAGDKLAMAGPGAGYYRTILPKSPIFHDKRLFKTYLEVVEIEGILLM
jgi:hypothetical protein